MKLEKKMETYPVTIFQITPNRIYIDIVHIDGGRHEHTVGFDRTIEPSIDNILKLTFCDCTHCATFAINSRELCDYKKRAFLELVSRKYLKPEFWQVIKEHYDEKM
jgi:hypothetical protein